MKLLLDQNLSRRLLADLAATYPGSSQVQLLGLETATDLEVWAYAKDHEFTIVTKDTDFVELTALRGIPPKIIWLNIGNVSNVIVREKLNQRFAAIDAFLESAEDGVLEIE